MLDFPFVVLVLDGGGYGYLALVEGRVGFVVSLFSGWCLCWRECIIAYKCILRSTKKHPETLLEVTFSF